MGVENRVELYLPGDSFQGCATVAGTGPIRMIILGCRRVHRFIQNKSLVHSLPLFPVCLHFNCYLPNTNSFSDNILSRYA
jgi:hypothetical protein